MNSNLKYVYIQTSIQQQSANHEWTRLIIWAAVVIALVGLLFDLSFILFIVLKSKFFTATHIYVIDRTDGWIQPLRCEQSVVYQTAEITPVTALCILCSFWLQDILGKWLHHGGPSRPLPQPHQGRVCVQQDSQTVPGGDLRYALGALCIRFQQYWLFLNNNP